MVTYFLNEAWKMAVAKRLEAYDMSGGRVAFYFDVNKLPDPEVKFLGVAGKTSRRGLRDTRPPRRASGIGTSR
jgi:hypothetical protein